MPGRVVLLCAAALSAVAAAAVAAERDREQAQAIAARVRAAEAELAAGHARAGAIGDRLAAQHAALARAAGPTVELLAALSSVARRPTWLAIAQPGSLADLVHVRAVLNVALPQIDQRTAALRADVARTRSLQASAAAAAQQLRAGRARLVEAREQLAALNGEDERALALEENARETAESLAAIGSEQAVLADLIDLPGPPATFAGRPAAGAYRLPVQGRLVTGMGEISRDGVRARGLTLAVRPNSAVIAPAGGQIQYAQSFRSYGGVVIVDHGAGWSSVITGLGTLAVARGATVGAGAVIGHAPRRAGARITVELRRRGRPMDIAQLAG